MTKPSDLEPTWNSDTCGWPTYDRRDYGKNKSCQITSSFPPLLWAFGENIVNSTGTVRLIKSKHPPPFSGSYWGLLMWVLSVQSLMPHPRAPQLHFHYFPLFITVGLQKPICVVISPLLDLCCLFLNLSHNPIGCLIRKCWLHHAVGTPALRGTLSSSRTVSSGSVSRSGADSVFEHSASSYPLLQGSFWLTLH